MDDLLELALDEPDEARQRARSLLEEGADPGSRALAHQCLGIVAREAGNPGLALRELQSALDEARRSKTPELVCDVQATYGLTLITAGRTDAGLRQLDLAVARGVDENGRVRMRRGIGLGFVGRRRDAIEDLRIAHTRMRNCGDRLWEARTLNTLGYFELLTGRVREAEGHVAAAEHLFVEEGLLVDAALAAENLGEIATSRGSLARALWHYANAEHGLSAARLPPRPELTVAHAACLISAGLGAEAVAALRQLLDQPLADGKAADVRLALASSLLAAGQASEASLVADEARRMFRRQQRPWFEMRARLVGVRARVASGSAGRLVRESRHVAQSLHGDEADEAPLALTLAGRLSTGEERREAWRAAASYRNHPNALVRAAAWLARALEREDAADRGGVLRACAAGLDAIDEQRRLLGSSELRALATTHGRELTTVALRHAAHDPRTLLRWSERTRATALAQPPATSDAATIPASLAALRDNGRKLAEARQAGEPTADLERERLRLERAVRSEHHTLSPNSEERQRPATAEEVVAGVRDGCLVELVDVDGNLHLLVVHAGRVRHRVAGSTAEIGELLAPTAMLLRRAARGRPAAMTELGLRLQEAILGDAVRLIPHGPVVLAPTARLHGLPWAVLPALADRPFSVVPSAGQWLRAQDVRRPRARRTVLVAGPALQSGGAEVPVLAKRLDDAELLDGPAATVEAVLDHLDGADLVHLAAHGRFRADSPLFSALDLADGPLTVHDLERVPRAPYRVVLSACESGVLAPVGAEELLGLAAALFSLGSAGLVCSVAEVNDAATAELMVGLHDGLARGLDPAHALLEVRRAAAADGVAAGTAASFVALGV